jgi:RNA polymerase sigma-70 factor (ECF subfamily)
VRLEQDGRLTGYPYLPAVKADLLSQLGLGAEAAAAYQQALDLTANEAERAFLADRLTAQRGVPDRGRASGGATPR